MSCYAGGQKWPDAMDEPFTLTRQPAKGRPKFKTPVPTDATRQGVLFTGGDCLPGQEELFQEPIDAQNARAVQPDVDRGP